MNEKTNIIYNPKLTISHSLSLLTPYTPIHAIVNKSHLTPNAQPSRERFELSLRQVSWGSKYQSLRQSSHQSQTPRRSG